MKKIYSNKTSSQHKIFLGGLPKKLTDSSLEQHLSKFGDILDLNIKRKITTGDCLGYGQATVSPATFNTLIKMGTCLFQSRKITFDPYLEGNKLKSHLTNLNHKRIFVRNIPKNSTSKFLKKFFSRLGKVKTAYPRNVPKSAKTIGVVFFFRDEDAESAVEKVNSDKNGPFKNMSATYKFVTHCSNNKQSAKEKKKRKKNKKKQKKLKKINHDVRPGKKGYLRYGDFGVRPSPTDLRFNVAKKNSRKNLFNSEKDLRVRSIKQLLFNKLQTCRNHFSNEGRGSESGSELSPDSMISKRYWKNHFKPRAADEGRY